MKNTYKRAAKLLLEKKPKEFIGIQAIRQIVVALLYRRPTVLILNRMTLLLSLGRLEPGCIGGQM